MPNEIGGNLHVSKGGKDYVATVYTLANARVSAL